jgi:hypothetical protein
MKSRLDFLMFATAFGKTKSVVVLKGYKGRDIDRRLGSSYLNI